MNRRYLVLVLTSLLCCLLLFTVYPSIKLSDNFMIQYEPRGNKLKTFEKKGAFATVLCDVDMIEPTLVSLYTLNSAFARKPASKSDIVILIPEDLNMNNNQLQQFKKLNTNVIRTSYPGSNSNSCNSIINLWALFDYQKIVYFTPDILFENNVDQLFNYPAGSAIYSQKTDTPLFVLEPNTNSFESLMRDYRKVSKKLNLSQLLYNEYLDYQLRIPSNLVESHLQVLEGDVKPWNFHQYQDSDWNKAIDAVKFYKWRRLNNDIRHLFVPSTKWENSLRQRTVCDNYINSVDRVNSFTVKDKFSVLISTYNPERIEHLSLIIRHLLKSSKVHTVYITWHNPNLEVPPTLYEKIEEKDYSRIKVLAQTFDSLNNRFNPIDSLKTEAVYIMDDDIYIDIKDLEFTFDIWRNRKDSVVGHFPRYHTYNKKTHDATYKLIGKAPYTIILTKSMFIRSEYLFGYTCLLEPKLHEYVDERLNCEDIGFMMMASGVSGSASTFVHTKKPLEDFGLKKGISTNNAHMPARSQCVSDFITQFWDEKDPLITSYDTITRFSKPTIRIGDWDRVEKTIMN